MAFEHVHPTGDGEGVGFAATFPTAGSYRLFLQFKHEGRVQTVPSPGGLGVSTLDHVVLPITGMTCASCANQIERNLNELDGVSATVNYATEKATVDFDAAAVDTDALVAAVEAAGYQAALPAADGPAGRPRGPRTRPPCRGAG